jgi:hypothetical protein
VSGTRRQMPVRLQRDSHLTTNVRAVSCRGSDYRPVHGQSGEFLDLGSQFSASIAGVDDRAGLEQQHRGFGIGLRTVLDAAGDDEELPRREHHVAVSHLDGELSIED